jgi:hypothetical protein
MHRLQQFPQIIGAALPALQPLLQSPHQRLVRLRQGPLRREIRPGLDFGNQRAQAVHRILRADLPAPHGASQGCQLHVHAETDRAWRRRRDASGCRTGPGQRAGFQREPLAQGGQP